METTGPANGRDLALDTRKGVQRQAVVGLAWALTGASANAVAVAQRGVEGKAKRVERDAGRKRAGVIQSLSRQACRALVITQHGGPFAVRHQSHNNRRQH